MTAEYAAILLQRIQSAYPNDAWKLNAETDRNASGHGLGFLGEVVKAFILYDDEEVNEALEKCLDNETKMPSIAIIKRYAVEIRQSKRIPYYQELPAPREKVDMSIIEKARNEVFSKDKKYTPVITDELRNFAKSHFHDITDALIAKNYCELLCAMESGCTESGYPITMWMNKKTGCIDTRICIPYGYGKSGDKK